MLFSTALFKTSLDKYQKSKRESYSEGDAVNAGVSSAVTSSVLVIAIIFLILELFLLFSPYPVLESKHYSKQQTRISKNLFYLINKQLVYLKIFGESNIYRDLIFLYLGRCLSLIE